ncbi:mitochondrial 54S ribosomal protein mL67 [Phyllosticta citriasiana]|uniref:Large ribosomal subunit protein mL67 n=1 Tax=Phyllosticta citriasiana TaxID=595635 RepID=A0ABR1KT85_9PEZI
MSGLGTQAARGIEASKEAARQIFVYCHFRTNQTLYSLNDRVLHASHLEQLPFAGKKTLPSKLRKDVWRPLAVVTFPFEKQASDAYLKLLDFKKLHELYWKENMDKDWGALPKEKQEKLRKRNKMPSMKERAKIIMDQKANSIAAIAKAMELQKQSSPAQFEKYMARDDQVEDLFWLRSLLRNLNRLEKNGRAEELQGLLKSTETVDENAKSGQQRLRLALTLLKRHRILSRPAHDVTELIDQVRSEYTPIREQLRDREFAYLDSLRQERDVYGEVRDLRKHLGILAALSGNVHREEQQWRKHEAERKGYHLNEPSSKDKKGNIKPEFMEELRENEAEHGKLKRTISDLNWKREQLERQLAEKKEALEETNESILDALYPPSQKPKGTIPKKGPLHQKAMLRTNRPRPFTLDGVEIKWANIVDLEHAESWPEAIFHESLAVERYKPNMSRVVVDRSRLPDLRDYVAVIRQEREVAEAAEKERRGRERAEKLRLEQEAKKERLEREEAEKQWREQERERKRLEREEMNRQRKEARRQKLRT